MLITNISMIITNHVNNQWTITLVILLFKTSSTAKFQWLSLWKSWRLDGCESGHVEEVLGIDDVIVRLETETESGACVALAPGEETATKTIGKWGLKEKTWWFYGIYYSWFENEVHHQIIILMGNMVINHEFLGYPVLKQTQMVISPTKNGDFLWKIGICSWCTWLGWFLGWSGGHNELVNGWN